MKRRYAILGRHASEILPISKDEMDIMVGLHTPTEGWGEGGVPAFFSEDGRYFPPPMREIIIVQDVFGF